ncbi:MAG: hypothetical protein V4480_00410 [Patescibacteria group bacterium]
MTPGEHLLAIADAGLAFSDLPAEDSRLGILLDIENILDKGRGYANLEERSLVNKKMDELRGRIRTILDSIPTEEAMAFMTQRGRGAQNQFAITGRPE